MNNVEIDKRALFFKALKNMNKNFSSDEFLKEAQRIGFKIINHKEIAEARNFLNSEAVLNGRRSWVKLPEMKTEEIRTSECIEYLKSLGYKIMKPISDYVEI